MTKDFLPLHTCLQKRDAQSANCMRLFDFLGFCKSPVPCLCCAMHAPCCLILSCVCDALTRTGQVISQGLAGARAFESAAEEGRRKRLES